jgi:hypothetical protein
VATADLVALAERVSEQPLGDLFDAWVERKPLPALPAA